MSAESELAWLTAGMCEGTLTTADRKRLERLLEDPAARRHYIALTSVHAGLQWRFRKNVEIVPGIDSKLGSRVASDPVAGGSPDGSAPLFPANPSADRYAAFAILGGKAVGLLRRAIVFLLRPASFSLLASALIIAAGLTIAAFVSVRHSCEFEASSGRGLVVAHVLRQHEARWREPLQMPDLNRGITAAMQLDLLSGLVEIELSGGGRIILQGPALLTVPDGSTVQLDRGLLHARFDAFKQSQARQLEASTLEVRTPVATLTDLGTEFGVGVGEDGTSEVHVFEGLVELKPRMRNASLVPPRLGPDDAMHVDGQGNISASATALAKKVVRKMPSREPPPDWVEERAITLFHDRFDAAGPIEGRVAEVHAQERGPLAVAWRASTKDWVMTNGALRGPAAGGVASVPFVPEPGFVYRLSVTMDVPSAAGGSQGWAAVGFLPNSALAFYGRPGAYAWVGQRTASSPLHGGNFAAGGPSDADKIPNIDQRYGRHVRVVQLDTRRKLWRVKFLVDGDDVAWHVFADGTPPIESLAVGTRGTTAEFRDVRLQVYQPDSDDPTNAF